MEYFLGGVATFCAALLLFIAFVIGGTEARSSVAKHCVDFEKVEIIDEWYSCGKIEG